MADSEQFVRDVSERLRAIVTEAEQRATQIVADAEREAGRIRARAEAEGHKRLAEVREALDRLEGRLGGAPDPGVGPGPGTAPEPEPGTPAEPETGTPAEPEPGTPAEPEPGTPAEAEPGTPAAPGNGDAPAEDVAGARLVAMNLALEGSSREEIVARLAEDFDLEDAGGLADEVLARAGK